MENNSSSYILWKFTFYHFVCTSVTEPFTAVTSVSGSITVYVKLQSTGGTLSRPRNLGANEESSEEGKK